MRHVPHRGLVLATALLAAIAPLGSSAGEKAPIREIGPLPASTEPEPVYIFSSAQSVELPDGAVVHFDPAPRARAKTDFQLGEPVRVPREDLPWLEILHNGGYANSTDSHLGSTDYLDERASQITWTHSAGGGNAHLAYTKNAVVTETWKCPTGYFGFTVGNPVQQLLCYPPNSTVSYAKGYRHVLPGPAVFQSRINPNLAAEDFPYTVRPATQEIAGGNAQETVIGERARATLQVRLKDADGNVVRMPIAGNSTPFSVRIESPSRAVGAQFQFVGSAYPDADGIAEGHFVAGDKAGAYRVIFTHPDAGLESVAFTVTALERKPPEDDEEHEEENGKEDCASVGDPITLSTGNVFEVETDYVRTGLSPLEFVRVYNSQGSKSSMTGTFWSTTYDRFVMAEANDTQARVRRPDGRTIRFALQGTAYVAQPHFRGQLSKVGTGWRYVDEDSTVEDFDALGRLVKFTDLDGLQSTVTRNNKGQIASVATNAGGTLTFTYTAAGQVETLKDGIGRTWTYAYDAWANLRSVRLPSGAYRSYRYESPVSPYLLTSARFGLVAGGGSEIYGAWEYDTQSRATASYAMDGSGPQLNRVEVDYFEDGTRIVTDANLNSTTFGVVRANGRGFVQMARGPGFPICGLDDGESEFDAAMRVTASTSFGRRTEFGNYDAFRQPGYRIDAAGTPSARRTDFTYDTRFAGRPTQIVAPSVAPGHSKVVGIDYNAQGKPTRVSINGYRPDGASVSRTVHYEYNGPFGQISKVDGPRTDVNDVTLFAYDVTTKRLKSVTNANGLALRNNLVYTPTGQPSTETRPNGLTLTYTYHPTTDRLESLTETGDGITRVTRWTYDTRGLVTSIGFGNGTTTHEQTSFGYNAAGDLTSLTAASGGIVVFSRDAAGNVDLEQTKIGSETRRAIDRTFDAYHRVDHLIGANNLVDYDYHPDGTLTRQVDGRLQTTAYTYDDFKRLKTIMRPGNAVTTLGYDVADRLTSVTDANLGQTQYGFDDLGNQVTLQSPDTGTSSASFDAAGNVVSTLDAKGQATAFTYDATNRLLSVDRVGTEYDETHSYDTCAHGAGRLCEILNGLGELAQFEYDPQGRITKVTNNGLSVGYSYNAAGRLVRLSYPSGRAVVYERNSAGRVTAVRLDANGTLTPIATAVTHQPFGPVASWTYGNGLTHSRTYDQQYWPRSIATGTVSASSFPGFDGNGNITGLTLDGVDHEFGYDAHDRLQTATTSGAEQGYGYDAVGNRTSYALNGATTTYGYEPQSNRIATETGWLYQLDANGNVQEKLSTTGPGGKAFSYSAHNRLTAAYDLAAPLVPLGAYRYNGLGQRAQKTVAGLTTRFVYGLGPTLLAEVQNGVVIEEYVYLEGIPLALLGPPPAGSGPAPMFEVTRDNGAVSGDWSVASYNGAVGGSYLYLDQSRQQANDEHAWSWNIPVAGKYRLEALWAPPNNSGITSQRYYIDNQFGELVNIGPGSRGTWVAAPPLISLAPGVTTVTLFEIYNGTQRLFADAMRLTLVQVDQPAPQLHYIHADHRGAPLAVTNQTKQVVWRAAYDPFGAANVMDDVDDNGIIKVLNLRFAGQYWDGESGLQYNYYRDYDPSTGRFMQSDPIGLDGGINTFVYVFNNPLKYIDPLGLAVGHHYFPQSNIARLDLSPDSEFIFRQTTTGPLPVGGHQYDRLHRRYNVATMELFQTFVGERGIDPAKMTATQAYDFLEAIGRARDPRIRGYLAHLVNVNRISVLRKLLRRVPGIGVPLVCWELATDENYSIGDAANDELFLLYGEDLH